MTMDKIKIINIIEHISILIFLILAIHITIQEFFDHRPFQFEKYKNDRELQKAAQFYFPIGSNINMVINKFEKSGAKCSQDTITLKYHVTLTRCSYLTNFLSFHPNLLYQMLIYADKSNKLIDIFIHRRTMF